MPPFLLRPFFALLLLALLLFSCTEEDIVLGRAAEGHYVELLDALVHEDTTSARTSVRALSGSLPLSGGRLRGIGNQQWIDDQGFHLNKAEQAFRDCRASIDDGQLELAGVQLDRAVYELSAARLPAYGELYVAGVYDFIATWLAVSEAVQDQELCQLEWPQFSRHGRDARFAWRAVRWQSPSPLLYGFSPEETNRFTRNHALLDTSIDYFLDIVATGDQCAAQVAAREVDDALWALLAQFRTAGQPEL